MLMLRCWGWHECGYVWHACVCAGWADLVDRLLSAGADVHIRNAKGWSAIQSAANSGWFEIVLRMVQVRWGWGAGELAGRMCARPGGWAGGGTCVACSRGLGRTV